MAWANPKPIVLKFTTNKANYDLFKDASNIKTRLLTLIPDFEENGCVATITVALDTGKDSQIKTSQTDEWNDFLGGRYEVDRPLTLKNCIIKDTGITGTILIDLY